MAGFKNGTVYGSNIDLSGSTSPIPTLLTDGQILVASTALNVGGTHVNVGKLLSPLGTLSIGFTTPNITIDIAGGKSAIETLTPNSGTTPVVPDGSNNITLVGSGSTTTVGSLNTLTVQLTGLTNHAILVGAGTTTITKVGPSATAGQILQSAGASADPAFSTSTYPTTNAINTLLYASSANVMAALATANQGVLTTGTTGIPAITAIASNGSLIIGSTAGAPAAATLTQGTGVTITNGSNSITIAVTNPFTPFTWTDVTTITQNLAVNSGYVTDYNAGQMQYTLPATASLGDLIQIVGKLGTTSIVPNANQSIVMSSATCTVGITGQVRGTSITDCVSLICTTAGASTVWTASTFVGNWTVT